MPTGLKLLDDLTTQGRLGIGSSWLHLSSLPYRAVPAHALLGWGGGERKNVNGTFPDSHPSWARRKKGGFRLGCVPAGKVGLSCVALPPEARAHPREGWWRHRVGSGSCASLLWHRVGESFQVDCGRG